MVDYWFADGPRAYHHTAPINMIYALHEGLRIVDEEGLEARWARHARAHEALRAALSVLGFERFAPDGEQLHSLLAVRVPEAIDEAAVRGALLREDGIEISGGLGPLAGRAWRIGVMGEGARQEPQERLVRRGGAPDRRRRARRRPRAGRRMGGGMSFEPYDFSAVTDHLDPAKFADLLAGYCLDVQPGQQVLVRSTTLAAPLLLELQRAILEREAWRFLRVELPGEARGFYDHAQDLHLDNYPSLAYEEARKIDATVGIQAPDDVHALAGVDPERMARAARGRRDVREQMLKKRWCSTLWPTPRQRGARRHGARRLLALRRGRALPRPARPARRLGRAAPLPGRARSAGCRARASCASRPRAPT